MRILRPSRQIPADLNHVIQLPAPQRMAEFIRIPITRITQYQTILQSPPSDFVNQVQSQFRLCLECDLFRNPRFLSPDGIINPGLRKIQRPIQRCTRFLRSQIQRHRYLAVSCLSQGTTVLSRHSHRVLTLLGKRYFVDKPVSFWNKFSLHLSGQRRSYLPRRPWALIYKLLQSLNISISKAICHWLDGLAIPIHQETSNVFLGMLSPLFATHGQNYISQEGLQLQPESFYLSRVHTRECILKYY